MRCLFSFSAMACGWLAATCQSHAFGTGGKLGGGHVDCGIHYINGQWIAGYIHDPASNPVDPNAPAEGPRLSLETTVLIARDQLFETGSRVLRPAGAGWNFIGVAAGAPLWWFPQTNWAEGNYVGFTISGPFARYQETDPRLAGSGPEKWGRIQCVSVQYRGKGDGRFSVWTNSTASGLKVWVDSSDGFQPGDRYFVGDNGHGHPAFGFSSLGLYKVGFQGRAWLDAALTQEAVSPVYPSYIAVGTYAEWIADHFSPARWFIPEEAGEQADPDADGIPNLMEYACGLHPRVADHTAMTEDPTHGLPRMALLEDGRLIIHTLQRAPETNAQISYHWETAASPEADTWQDLAPAWEVPSVPGWTKVVYVMDPAAAGRQFGRLRVELLESITYP